MSILIMLRKYTTLLISQIYYKIFYKNMEELNMTDPYSPENIANTINNVSTIGIHLTTTIVELAKKIICIFLIIGLFILSCLNLIMYLCTPSIEDAGIALCTLWLSFVTVVQLLYYLGIWVLIRRVFFKKKKNKYNIFKDAPYNGTPQPAWKKQADMNHYSNYYNQSLISGKYEDI